MRVTVLRTHIDKEQNRLRRGDQVDMSDREAEIKIDAGLVEATGEKRSEKPRKATQEAPENAAHKKAPATKKPGPVKGQGPSKAKADAGKAPPAPGGDSADPVADK